MGSINSGAVANIREAARRVGIPPERITNILVDSDASTGITFNDGAAPDTPTPFKASLRRAFNQMGYANERADHFYASIVALDTGIVGTGAVPDLEGLTRAEAERAANGFALDLSETPDLGDFPIGTIDDQQSPAAAASADFGDTITADIQTGQTVPDSGEGVDETAFLAALTTAGLVAGDDTTANSETIPVDDIISSDPAAGTLVEYGAAVDYVISLGPEE